MDQSQFISNNTRIERKIMNNNIASAAKETIQRLQQSCKLIEMVMIKINWQESVDD